VSGFSIFLDRRRNFISVKLNIRIVRRILVTAFYSSKKRSGIVCTGSRFILKMQCSTTLV
jgi:hypothetical protein